MNKEVISDKQCIHVIIMNMIGIETILTSGIVAKQDLWIAILLSLFTALLIILIYARIHHIFLGNDLFDILEICFGKYIGKGICILFFLHFLLGSSAIVYTISEFIIVVSLPETPKIFVMIIIMIICVWSVKAGIEVIGRTSEIFLTPIVGLIFVTILLLVPKMDINNIRPTLYRGIKPIVEGVLSITTIQFLAPMLMLIFSNFESRKSPYKVYISGLLCGGVIIFATSVTNVLVLGVNHAESLYYPSYVTVSRVDIGNVLQRMEAVAAIVFILGGVVKLSIYLLATCKGFAKICKCENYRFLVTPVALFILNQSYSFFDSTMEYLEIAKIWGYYAFLFQVILPIIIWTTAEIKKK
ncbi:GerAB/ArcD/ProY family transporter [Tepidibacter aestuarii]|uniref:GerAB/ArcD/ProY family transporter n=1 Tax=Tepidibacter aestuarii TaxID=2925782 RepID=UPI0020C08B37|nr:endospore germination permease [Tepidibacter aestuarii]CAH2213456.1 spore germination protein KB [Tepidibacter aestuarii]